MVAAAQQGACPALKACAFALLSCSRVERAIATLDALAAALKSSGAILAPRFICNAVALVREDTTWHN